MQSVFPSTDLKTNLRQIKDNTRDALAIITEGGRGRYLFGSETAFDHEIETASWEEANAARIIVGIEQGRSDIARGAFVVGTDAAIAWSEELRRSRG